MIVTEGRGGKLGRMDQGDSGLVVWGNFLGSDASVLSDVADEERIEDVAAKELAGGCATDEGGGVGALDNLEQEIRRERRQCWCGRDMARGRGREDDRVRSGNGNMYVFVLFFLFLSIVFVLSLLPCISITHVLASFKKRPLPGPGRPA